MRRTRPVERQARWQLLMLRPRGVAGRKAAAVKFIARQLNRDRDAEREAGGIGKTPASNLRRDNQ